MIVRRGLIAAAVSFLLINLLSGQTYAGFVGGRASESAEIIPAHGDGHPKILVKFDIPQETLSSQVDYAEIELPVLIGQMSPRLGGVKAWALSTDWDAETVSWTYPWSRAGGDHEGQSSPVSILRARDTHSGTATIRLDVTDLVQSWADNHSNNHGLAISSTDQGFGTSSWEVAGSKDEIVLRVYFTNR